MKKILHEEVEAFVLAKIFTHSVMNSWEDNKLKVLSRLNECIDNLISARRVNVVVEFSDYEHQRSAQFMGIEDVAAFYIARVYRPSHPLFVPPYFIHAVVVASAAAVGRFVEVAMKQYGCGAFLSSCRGSENTNAR